MMIPLTDAHAHLADNRLANILDDVLEFSKRECVTQICVNAARLRDWDAVIQLSRRPGIYGALGQHPFFPDLPTEILCQKLNETLDNAPVDAKIIAIGEIGLDAWNGRQSIDLQTEQFIQQLKLAMARKLPVAIHSRKTWSDFFRILKELNINNIHGYCHSFGGSVDVARNILDKGMYLSFGGPAAAPNATRIHDVIKFIPLDRILTESDAPDQPPRNANTALSQPPHVKFPLEVIATLKHAPVQAVAEQIAENFRNCLLAQTL